jgi:beta-fructofuranosidase
MWECVDLFRPPTVEGAGSLDVLAFSAWHDGHTLHPHYWTGTAAADSFEPRRLERLDYGGRYFYAPQSMSDDQGRRIMFAWLQEGRSDEACVAAGWYGAMSLPRTVVLGADGALELSPAPEVARLRGQATVHPAGPLTTTPVALGSGDQLDVEMELRLAPGSAVALTVLATPDGAEQTVLRLERAGPGQEATMSLDRSLSSTDGQVDRSPASGPVPLGEDGQVAVRVLVDHSALEVFAGGRALTSRVYPTRDDARGAGIALLRGSASLDGATTWPMRGIWSGGRQLWP